MAPHDAVRLGSGPPQEPWWSEEQALREETALLIRVVARATGHLERFSEAELDELLDVRGGWLTDPLRGPEASPALASVTSLEAVRFLLRRDV